MKKLIVPLIIFALVALAVDERRLLMMWLSAMKDGGSLPELAAPGDEGAGVRWHDDYFTVVAIDDRTFAIGEPRYPYQNFSYLIAGKAKALLFDGGPGIRDIRAVAESLTDVPITFMPSHLHFDHVANQVSFERVALIDVDPVRARATENRFSPSSRQHLGFMEGWQAPEWEVSEWIEPGSRYDLGERSIEIHYTPGHTTDSVSVYDAQNGILFSGDYLYPGPLWAFLPNSSMRDYLQTAGPLLERLPADTIILGAHRESAPGLPSLAYQDLVDLQAALIRLRDGELSGAGTWPVTFEVNDRLQLVAEPRWLQDW